MNTQIDGYITRLGRGLHGMPKAERDRFVQEIRSHLEDRAAAGDVSDPETGLGSADALARSFADDYRASRDPPKPAVALAMRTGSVLVAGVFAMVALVLYSFGGLSVLVGVMDIFYPRSTGVFTSFDGSKPMGEQKSLTVTFNGGDHVAPTPGHDVLGHWITPLALLIAALLFVAATLIVRHGVWRMLFRNVAGRADR